MLQGKPEKELEFPKLADLIDVSILQQIQDWAARTAGISILIRDSDGYPVTHASMSNEFCTLISGEEHTNPECRKSNIIAAALAAKAGKPQKYTCYAGLTQFAAPIQIEGHLLGTIVLGDRPIEPIDFEKVKELAEKFNLDFDRLMKAAMAVETWSEETMNNTINFLYTIANTLIRLCYQGYSLKKKVNELTVLLEINQLLISSLDPQEILDRIAEGVVLALNVKASIIRLLDDSGTELTLKSIYNLSPDYLSKGPVILKDHPICQAALNGDAKVIYDVSTDPRFIYNEAAKREGLRSMLCVGMKSKEKAIGTVHLYTKEPHIFTEDEIKLAQSIANQAAIAIENAYLYKESIEKQRIERELAMAVEVQSALLPTDKPLLNGIDIKAKIVPCSQLSGDLYDFIEIGKQNIGIVIADVSGKGTPGALLMATTHANIHAVSEDTPSVSDIIDKTNKYLCKYTRSTEFITLFYGILNADDLTFTYSNAGHNPPIIFREGLGVFLENGGIPLGIIEDTTYSDDQIKLIPGDIIVLYTDGVTEATNKNREIFGVSRLMRTIQKNMDLSSTDIVSKIYDEIISFANGAPQNDDLTIVVIKVVR